MSNSQVWNRYALANFKRLKWQNAFLDIEPPHGGQPEGTCYAGGASLQGDRIQCLPYRWNNLAVTIDKQGPGRIGGKGDPMRLGRYSEIRTRDYEFQFNLNGEVRFIRGLGTDWPHPYECLKRTDGNDWIYYSVSAVQNLIDLTGGYYLPACPTRAIPSGNTTLTRIRRSKGPGGLVLYRRRPSRGRSVGSSSGSERFF